MNRAYYQILRESNDICRLALAVVQNADYKEACMNATDPLVSDIIKGLQSQNRMLQEVLNRQEYAHVQSLPE